MSLCQKETIRNNLKFPQSPPSESIICIIRREVGVMQQRVDGVVCAVAVPEELQRPSRGPTLPLSGGPPPLTCNITLGRDSSCRWPPQLAPYWLAFKTGMTPLLRLFSSP